MKYPEEIAYTKLVDWCNKAERCRFDLARKLSIWGAEKSFIDACIDRLRKSNLFDDARFASAYAHDKSNLQRWGAQKIKMHLKAKSISDESIREALGHLENEVQQENIRELVKRKCSSVKGKTPYERNAKLIQFLLRKGFAYDVIKRELSTIEEWPEEFNHL